MMIGLQICCWIIRKIWHTIIKRERSYNHLYEYHFPAFQGIQVYIKNQECCSCQNRTLIAVMAS